MSNDDIEIMNIDDRDKCPCKVLLAYLKTLDGEIAIDLKVEDIKLYMAKKGGFRLELGKKHVFFDKFGCYYRRGILKDGEPPWA